VPNVDSDGLASGSVGSSRLYLRSISAQGVQQAIEWQQLENVDFVPRVAVRPTTATDTLDVLDVLYATSADGGMPDVQALEAGSFTGVFVDVPTLARAVLFSQDVSARSAGGDLDVTLPDRPLARVIVADVPAGSYAITATRSSAGLAISVRASGSGSFTASAAGLLRFDVRDGVVEATPDDPPIDQPVITRPDGGVVMRADGGSHPMTMGPAGGCGCRTSAPSGSGVAIGLLLLAMLRLTRAGQRGRQRRMPTAY
jgi:hypothetical protein